MRLFFIVLFFFTLFLISSYFIKQKRKSAISLSNKEKEKEKIILQVAKNKGGRVTPVEIATETDLSTEEAEMILKNLAKKGYAEIIISDSGILIYELAFLSDDEKYKTNSAD